MSFKYSVEIEPGFEDSLLQEVNKILASKIRQRTPGIYQEVRNLILQNIFLSETWQSLWSGDLRGELGVNKFRLNAILDEFANSLKITSEPKVHNNGISDVLIITAIENSYADFINHPVATFKSNEYTVPWLRWLLFSGTSIVVSNFHVETKLTSAQKARSRTGEAIMVGGSYYRIPAEHAGTQRDNFVTRALKGIDEEIIKILQQRIK